MKGFILGAAILAIPMVLSQAYADSEPPFITWLHNLMNYNAKIEASLQDNQTEPIVFSYSNGTSLAFSYSNGTDPLDFTYSNATNGISFASLKPSYNSEGMIVIQGTESPPTGVLTVTIDHDKSTMQTTRSIEDMQGNFMTILNPNNTWQAGTYQVTVTSSLHQNKEIFNLN